MAVERGNDPARPVTTRARAGLVGIAPTRLLRRVRDGIPGPRRRSPDELPARAQAATEPADLIPPGDRDQVRAQARVHGLVAVQVGELMQANVERRQDLRHQLLTEHDGGDLSAAWLRSRIDELDRLITQQVATVDWHLREVSRLRQRIGAE